MPLNFYVSFALSLSLYKLIKSGDYKVNARIGIIEINKADCIIYIVMLENTWSIETFKMEQSKRRKILCACADGTANVMDVEWDNFSGYAEKAT